MINVQRSCGLLALALAASPSLVNAQPAAPGEVSLSFVASALGQRETSLDEGGRFNWSGTDASVAVKRQFTRAVSAGINARLASERWSFKGAALGAAPPWKDLLRPSIGADVSWALAPDMALFAGPQLEWSYESGARTSKALSYGGVFGVTKVFSPTLFIGLGAGAFHQIDRTRFFPFVIVNWEINEHWRLSNPLQAGPAGGAGLELAWTPSPDWEAAAGFAVREFRFRLRDDGPVPGGLGQNEGTPVFARVTRKFGPVAQIDLYAGWVTAGQLKLKNASGRTVQASDFKPAPLLAISGSFEF